MLNLRRTTTHGQVIPPLLLGVHANIAQLYGARFNVISFDPEWLNFRVDGMTDEVLIRDLERNAIRLFGSNLSQFQILRAQDGSEPGVFVHYLARNNIFEFRSGFYYY